MGRTKRKIAKQGRLKKHIRNVLTGNTFFGHKGRPGSIGGSMPRSFSSGGNDVGPSESWLKSQSDQDIGVFDLSSSPNTEVGTYEKSKWFVSQINKFGSVKAFLRSQKARREVKPLTSYHQGLTNTKVRSVDRMPASDNANVVYKVRLEDGTLGVFKSAIDMDIRSENSRKNISGKIAEREVLASEINDILGLKFVPTTVLKDVNGDLGSFQMYHHNGENAWHKSVFSKRFDGKNNERLAGAFDYLIGHSDRHENNWRLPLTANRLVLIDNGLSMPSGNEYEHPLTGDMVKVKLLNAHMLDHLERWDDTVPNVNHWKQHWPEIQGRLQDYGFDEGVQRAMKERLDVLVKHVGKPFAELQGNGPIIWSEGF
jgi:hypothetical protein